MLSDTHGYLDPKIFDYFSEVDEIWHAGDVGSTQVIEELRAFKPLRAVYGNIDDHQIRLQLEETERFWVEDCEVLMTHIAGRPGKYNQKVFEELEKRVPKIFVCGHSHILLVQKDPRFDMLWLNPGACGYKGFHKVKTLLRFEINGSQIQNMEAIEIGKRA